MPIDEDVVARARKFDRAAVETILTQLFPAVHRMAYALTGRADAGSVVERFVLKRSMRVLENWKDADAPERWFYHHTVLATRRARHAPTNINDDLLLVTPDDGTPDRAPPPAAYPASPRALRCLPMQQREAFILR